jgi:hypothetical protein
MIGDVETPTTSTTRMDEKITVFLGEGRIIL